MKHKILRHVLGSLFAVLFSVSAIGSLVSGWQLAVPELSKMYVMFAVCSTAAAGFWFFRYGGVGNLLMTGLILRYFWTTGVLLTQFRSLVFLVSNHYHEVYRWPVLGKAEATEFEHVLFLIGYLLILLVTYCICRIKPSWFVLPFVLIPLVLCLITTDTLPEECYLFMMILGIAVLMITEWVRRNHPDEVVLLTLGTAVPAAVVLALLFAMNPQETYVNHAENLQKEAISLFQKAKNAAQSAVEERLTGETVAMQTVNLRNIGPKSDYSYPVMRITSPYTGTLYLRGRDYDLYTGTTWESSERRSEILPSGMGDVGTLTITTNRVRDVLYIPYYSADMVKLIGGCAENTKKLKTYSYSVSFFMDRCAVPSDKYTALPDEAKAWAEKMADNILRGASAESEIVQKITAYVKKCAVYDLSTEGMDSTYDDFAQWFLQKSETGYCVHFATAAAVLLRASGIPARYVEGYAAHCQAKENTMISSTQAHAWVEYYDSELSSWRILEATPAGAITSGEIISDDEPEETENPAESEEPENRTEMGPVEEREDTALEPFIPGKEQGDTETGETTAEEDPLTDNMITDTIPVPQTRFRLPGWFKNMIFVMLSAAVLVSGILLQARIRAFAAWKRWNKGVPNVRAITRWKMSRRMAKRTKTVLPKHLEQLALKARFSQYTLTPEELSQFDDFRQQILEKVNNMPFFRRHWMRLWFALR